VPIASIESRAARLKPVSRRGSIVTLANGARVVDDSYNASPAATQAMLQALGATHTAGRRVAVLGEMLELGDSARSLHEACGRAAAAIGVDELVAVGGPNADGFVEGAVAHGLARGRTHRFQDSQSAAARIGALVHAGDLVLIKGSRDARMDVVVDRLKEGA
jgi:UDP-N-acetylmuramoyl-tripeptide--D-alanyl-D-alanine ligase